MSVDPRAAWLGQHTERRGGLEVCWPWIGPIEQVMQARAAAWLLAHGDIPEGKIPFRMKKCAARRCVNPDHLRLAENPDVQPWCSDCTAPLTVAGEQWRCDRCCIAGSFMAVGELRVMVREFEMPAVPEALAVEALPDAEELAA